MTARSAMGLALLALLAACGADTAPSVAPSSAPAPSAEGLLAFPKSVTVPTAVRELAVGRLNADRRDDLVVAGDLGKPAFVLLAEAGGGFAARALPIRAKHPAIADLDGDAAMDVAAVDGSGLVGLHRGQGDGGVAAPSRHATLGNAVQAPAADMDGDGDLDLLALNRSDLTLLRNNGSGGFDYPVRAGDPGYALAIETVDLGGDRSADVVVAGEDTITLMRNDGRGVLGAPEILAKGAGFEVADVNGDRRDDLLYPGDGLVIRLADGRGGLAEPIVGKVANGGPIAVRDLNGDTFPDLVLGEEERIRVVLGDGAGGFGAPATYKVDSGRSTLAIADVDGDCAPDVVAGYFLHERILVLRNTSQATCPPPAAPVSIRGRAVRGAARSAAAGTPWRGHLRRPDPCRAARRLHHDGAGRLRR